MQRIHLWGAAFAAGVLLTTGCGSVPATPPAPTPAPLTANKIYVAESGLNQLAVFNAVSLAPITTIKVGKGPSSIGWDQQHLWVANADDGTVSVIDPTTDAVIKTITVGTDPRWVLAEGRFVPLPARVYVANHGSKNVSVIDPSSLSVISTVSLAAAPFEIQEGAPGPIVSEDGGTVQTILLPTAITRASVGSSLNAASYFFSGYTNARDCSGDEAGARYTVDGTIAFYSRTGGCDGPQTLAATLRVPAGHGLLFVPPSENAQGYLNSAFATNVDTNQISLVNYILSKATLSWTTATCTHPTAADFGTIGAQTPLQIAYFVTCSGSDVLQVLSDKGSVISTLPLAAGAKASAVAYVGNIAQPSSSPTTGPTTAPTASPTAAPTASPTAAPTASPTAAPTATPAAGEDLYLANGTGNDVLVYAAPFSASSAPIARVATANAAWGVAVNASYVAIEDAAGNITIYNAPLTSGSSAIASFKGGASGGNLAFDSAGNLYSGTLADSVLVFAPPFTNSSTPSHVISGEDSAFSLAFDYLGNLYIGNIGEDRVDVLAPPYTGAALQVSLAGTYGLATNGPLLVGADAMAAQVQGYGLPLSSSSSASYFIANADPHAVTFGSDGTLFVGDQHGGAGSGTIDAYAQPLGSASTSAYAISNGVVEPVQLAAHQ